MVCRGSSRCIYLLSLSCHQICSFVWWHDRPFHKNDDFFPHSLRIRWFFSLKKAIAFTKLRYCSIYSFIIYTTRVSWCCKVQFFVAEVRNCERRFFWEKNWHFVFFYFRCHWPNFFWLYWFWFSLWYLWYLLYMKAEKSLSLERKPFEWRYLPVKWVLAWTCYCIRLHAWTTILDCMRLGLDLELMRLRALCITEYLHQHIVASLMILTFGQYVRKSQFHSNFTTKHLLALSPGLRIIAQKWIKKKYWVKIPHPKSFWHGVLDLKQLFVIIRT